MLSHTIPRPRLAAQIEGLNAQRRLLTNQVTKVAQLRETRSTEPPILTNVNGFPGAGIVANKLVTVIPAILFELNERRCFYGGRRGWRGFTSRPLLRKDIVAWLGGHPMAAGWRLKKLRFSQGPGAIETNGKMVRRNRRCKLMHGCHEFNLEFANL
jgi:hypothetical protein